MAEIKHFTDLDAWKEAHKFTITLYKVTKSFPKQEIFGITSQIRRASSSIGANLAEGFSRYHYGDRLNFYYQARASLSEVQNHMLLARDTDLLKSDRFTEIYEQSEVIHRLLNGLIRKTQELRSKST